MAYEPDPSMVIIAGGYRYRWIGCGYGAQLESLEWRTVLPGTERQIGRHTVRAFNASRQGLRLRVSWCLVAASNGTLDEQRARIVGFRDDLRQELIG